MRSIIYPLTLFALAVSVNLASAEVLENNFSIGMRIGATVNTSSGGRAELFPYTATFEGDLCYMVTEKIGLIPVSIVLQKYNFDDDKPELLKDHVEGLPQNIQDMNPRAWKVDGSAWGVAYLPGIHFTTAWDWPVNFFGQIGAGIYHYDESLEVFNFDSDVSKNEFASRFAGGIEIYATDRASVQLKADYIWTNTDHARDNLLGITGGITYLF